MTSRRVTAITVTAAAVLATAGCSSSPADTGSSQTIVVTSSAGHTAVATHPAASAVASAVPSPTCDMTKEPDVIVWYKVPGLQDSAQVLGGWSPETCKSSIPQIMAGAPTGDGYCTEVAWSSTNPGYNADATPAKPLKHVIEAVGGSC